MSSTDKKLPIGYSTLAKIQADNCLYIDKTHHISTLVNEGAYYFLSRPRRFGKSLFIDTLKQAFLANRSLFKNLYLDKKWDWSTQYPVIHLDFGGKYTQQVYNPFDILLFFKQGKLYKNYWFETGSPSFLLKLLQSSRYYLPQLENITLTENLLDSFDIERISIEALLFQTGYLTIKNVTTSPLGGQLNYQMSYPNQEVRTSLMTRLMDYFVEDQGVVSNSRHQIEQALFEKNFSKLHLALFAFFASVPYQWYTNNNIANYEGFYATIIYSLFNAIGVITIPEDATNKARIDLNLDVLTYRIIMEFKTEDNADAKDAIEQIKIKRYPEKYLSDSKPIYLIDISFDKTTKNISGFEWEKYTGL